MISKSCFVKLRDKRINQWAAGAGTRGGRYPSFCTKGTRSSTSFLTKFHVKRRSTVSAAAYLLERVSDNF